MVIFLVSFTATLVDYTLLNGGIGIIALCSGVFVLMVLIALKADGRGFSLTKMKNESEMKKIEQALKAQEESEKAKDAEQKEQSENEASENAEQNEKRERGETDKADDETDGGQ